MVSFSLFLVYRSFDLFVQLIHTTEANYLVSETIFLGFIINLFVTGVFALPGFAFPTSRLLSGKYYAIHHQGRLVYLYKILGVKYFRILLMVAFWGRKKNRKKYFDGTRTGIANLIYQSKQSEFGHLTSFLAILSITFYLALVHNYYYLFITTNLLNLFANGYPVILQRYHRLRIERLHQSRGRKEVEGKGPN